MRTPAAIAVIISLLLPVPGLAAGPHDALGCAGCHPTKGSGAWFLVPPNRKYADPATGRPFTGTTGVCLACHQTREAGGRGNSPVWRHTSHPFGVAPSDPRRSNVPAKLLVNGRVECLSCHDPHPANSGYKYLRDVSPDGSDVDQLCAACHPAKAG
jgi:predicted CXXCH cytochrome family protein